MTPDPDFGWSLPPGCTLQQIEQHYDAGVRVCAGCGRQFTTEDGEDLCRACLTTDEDNV